MKVLSYNENDTEKLASELASTIGKGTLIALHGNLGCGKTVFSRGFAKALGITDAVTSPTFTIVQEYSTADGSPFYHLDLYRIANDDEAIAFGIDEFIFDPSAISIIEWPERIPELLSDETIHVYLEHVDENTRSIRIHNPGAQL